jgi:hypothetical protein
MGKFALKEVNGDLFTAKTSLAHCVGADLTMGAGIAVMFRKQFARIDELRSQKVSCFRCHLDSVKVWNKISWVMTSAKHWFMTHFRLKLEAAQFWRLTIASSTIWSLNHGLARSRHTNLSRSLWLLCVITCWRMTSRSFPSLRSAAALMGWHGTKFRSDCTVSSVRQTLRSQSSSMFLEL